MKRLIFLSIVACLLTGCGVYRNYSRQNMEVEERYRNVETADTATIASLSWRELFSDLRLQALIEQGLQRNTDLQIARLKVEETKAVLMNAQLSYLPSLALNPETGISRYDGTTSKTYNLATSASWEVDIFGRNTNAKRGARTAFEGSKDYVQAVQTGLIASIAGSYYTLLMLDSQLAIGERTLESWEKSIRSLEALKRAGQSNDAAVLAGTGESDGSRIGGTLHSQKHHGNGERFVGIARIALAVHRARHSGRRRISRNRFRRCTRTAACQPPRRAAGGAQSRTSILCHQCHPCRNLSEHHAFGHARLDEQRGGEVR